MKTKHILCGLAIMALFSYASCKKSSDPVVDTHNRTLVNIPLEELKTILAGNWLLKKERICGFRPCYDTVYTFGQEDVFSFLPLDSVKRVKADATVLVYDKAVISKSSYDNSWVYTMYGGLRSWSFQEIKNDTLLATIDYSQGSVSYLVKKP
jgi:hypothetical protein